MINHGADMLKQAAETIEQRQSQYGPPEKNFSVIADRWNAHFKGRGYKIVDAEGLTVLLDSADVAHMSADIKMARASQTIDHEDSWLDMAGYAACGMQIVKSRKQAAESVSAESNGEAAEPVTWETFYWIACINQCPDDLQPGDAICVRGGNPVIEKVIRSLCTTYDGRSPQRCYVTEDGAHYPYRGSQIVSYRRRAK